MGRTPVQHGGQPLRSRGVVSFVRAAVAFLLVLVFGLQAVPFSQAQAKAPDCCMAADGKGCSMHLHRAQQAGQSGLAVAAVQPKCPCTPMAPASVTGHESFSRSSSKLLFALAAEGAARELPCSLCEMQATGSSGTRGPPVRKLLA